MTQYRLITFPCVSRPLLHRGLPHPRRRPHRCKASSETSTTSEIRRSTTDTAAESPDRARHFGLVVDDKEAVRSRLLELGVPVTGRGLDFHDPWGNLIQVVDYKDIQFTKADEVLRAQRDRAPRQRLGSGAPGWTRPSATAVTYGGSFPDRSAFTSARMVGASG